ETVTTTTITTEREGEQVVEKRKYQKQWLPEFLEFVHASCGQQLSELSSKKKRSFARKFCAERFASYEESFFVGKSAEEKKASWEMARLLAVYYPGVAVQHLGLSFGSKSVIILDEVSIREAPREDGASSKTATKYAVMLNFADDGVLVAGARRSGFYATQQTSSKDSVTGSALVSEVREDVSGLTTVAKKKKKRASKSKSKANKSGAENSSSDGGSDGKRTMTTKKKSKKARHTGKHQSDKASEDESSGSDSSAD
ncbi:hypothetical protein PybrP1_008351, partial [[Pythium] brassicae (nom. inval.)]